jgi:hypothetical protein
MRVGFQLSGGAQPGTSRLDLGPRVEVQIAKNPKPVSVAVEWRRRVAGHANPGSGPAITVFGGF